jgi:hypothetical protein
MIQVVQYKEGHRHLWNNFVAEAKNGVFLFNRDYMDYHAERFCDNSLMFFNERDQLIAILPANISGDVLVSHAGLTFGGVLSNVAMKVELMLAIFDSMISQASHYDLRSIVYKAVPHIYHRLPAEEDLYALFRNGAHLFRRDVSVTIALQEKRLPLTKGRKSALKQAKKAGLQIARSFQFEAFLNLEKHLLESKYGIRPVHTSSEMQRLATRFPDNIKLFAAHQNDEILGGVIIYESEQVAHAQYIGANEKGRRAGALDAIMAYLINDYYASKKFFDFGISTENGGRTLNAGLIENKQAYGARAVVHDFYELPLRNRDALHPTTTAA